MRQALFFHRLTAVLWCVAAACAQADEKSQALAGPRFSAEAAVGMEYDSNVSVQEVDASSDQSDYAALLELGLQMRKELPADAELSLSYDLSQSIYQTFQFLTGKPTLSVWT